MKDLNIDLGSKGMECCPPMAATDPKTYFPSFHYEGDKPMDLPDEGEMVIRYKKVSDTKEMRGDTPRYSCTIEIRKIVSAEEEGDDDAAEGEVIPPARNLSSGAGDALDKLMKEKVKEKKSKAGESY